jgi:hypothetical protein
MRFDPRRDGDRWSIASADGAWNQKCCDAQSGEQNGGGAALHLRNSLLGLEILNPIPRGSFKKEI